MVDANSPRGRWASAYWAGALALALILFTLSLWLPPTAYADEQGWLRVCSDVSGSVFGGPAVADPPDRDGHLLTELALAIVSRYGWERVEVFAFASYLAPAGLDSDGRIVWPDRAQVGDWSDIAGALPACLRDGAAVVIFSSDLIAEVDGVDDGERHRAVLDQLIARAPALPPVVIVFWPSVDASVLDRYRLLATGTGGALIEWHDRGTVTAALDRVAAILEPPEQEPAPGHETTPPSAQPEDGEPEVDADSIPPMLDPVRDLVGPAREDQAGDDDQQVPPTPACGPLISCIRQRFGGTAADLIAHVERAASRLDAWVLIALGAVVLGIVGGMSVLFARRRTRGHQTLPPVDQRRRPPALPGSTVFEVRLPSSAQPFCVPVKTSTFLDSSGRLCATPSDDGLALFPEGAVRHGFYSAPVHLTVGEIRQFGLFRVQRVA